MEEQKSNGHASESTPKVTGIGGIFFFSDNPEATKIWYSKHLGLEVNEWGSTFEFRNANKPDEINYLQWSPFQSGSSYFEPSNREFMVNYRVQHIEKLVEDLKSSPDSRRLKVTAWNPEDVDSVANPRHYVARQM